MTAVSQEYFSNNPNADKVRKVQADIDDVKSIMVQNIERLLERGEKIELLVSRADVLNEQAGQFKIRHDAQAQDVVAELQAHVDYICHYCGCRACGGACDTPVVQGQ